MLLYPTYFSPIAQYVAIAHTDAILFEVEDNYQKQTYRTRCYIYGANGKQLLNIPVQHQNVSRKTKDIKIDYSANWEKQHLKAMQMAYQSSPYYEFYEDEIIDLLSKKENYLLDLNLKSHELICDLLQLDLSFQKTLEFEKVAINDLRHLANAKASGNYNFDAYTQVFSDKYGFIENLSILDLLFMEGSNALNYLENQSLSN